MALPAGILSDRLGPKRIAGLGLALTVLSNVGLGYARDFTGFLVLKVIGGMGSGVAFIAGVRYVTVAFAPFDTDRVQGIYGGCSQLGGGTSLYLVPLLYRLLGWRGAFLGSSGLMVIALGLWMLLAPDCRMALPTSRVSEAIRSRTVWLLGLAHTGTFGLSIVVGTWITTFLVHEFDLPLVSAGVVGSAVLVAGIISRPLGGILIERRWIVTKTIIRASLLTSALGLGLLALPGRPLWAALVAILAMGIALSLPYSPIMNTVSAVVPESPGAGVGMVSAISLLLLSIGIPALGVMYAHTESFSVPFALLGGFCLLVFWITCHIRGEDSLRRSASRRAK